MKAFRPLFNSLSAKLIFWLVVSMVVIFGLLGYSNVKLQRHHLEDTVLAHADSISDVIKRSTRYSMMNNHRDEVYHIINTIGTEPGITKIRIFNEDGNIRYSTDESEVSNFVDKKAEACYACHSKLEPLKKLSRRDRARIYKAQDGTRVLGVINPIENERDCYSADCHAHPPDKTVLGVLDTNLSLAKVDESIAERTRQLVEYFAFAIIAISVMSGIFVWVMVHKPVKKLIVGTKRVARGELDQVAKVSANDEISDLASSFNTMVAELKRAREEITNWTRTLEERVERKSRQLNLAQEQLIHAEKMASMGKLAAIVAHEINNPLSGIYTYAKLVGKKITRMGISEEERTSLAQYMSTIETESARCGEIVKNLLQFARPSKLDLKPNDVNELMTQSLKLVAHQIELMGINVQTQLAEPPPRVVCDAQKVKQALVALLINACEAMKQGGTLMVKSQGLGGDGGAELTIQDTGIGMDAETRKHIFEPFFTTKEKGKGVGLGLAVLMSIVKGHGGSISLESEPGKGTSFTIFLPAHPPEAAGDFMLVKGV